MKMNSSKIFSLSELLRKLVTLRKGSITIGFTNGCFDLLHKGHHTLISKAKKNCDFLIVAVNTDKSVKVLKGQDRPIQKQKLRLENLSKIKHVDALILFNEETPLKIINQLLPDVLFKGEDYKHKDVIGSESVTKNGGRVELIEILEGFSTTNIIKNSSL